VTSINNHPPTTITKLMNHQLSAFIDDLKATHGKNLASVTLYGSAAAGDHVSHRSDYNLLIAL